MHIQHLFLNGLVLGCLATALFDVWLLGQKVIGLRVLNFAYLGRWIGHFRYLRFMHGAIAQAPVIAHEFWIGLLGHYVIGVALAGMLLFAAGGQWLLAPDAETALLVGFATVVLPLLIMQPSMGGGVAFTKTAQPFSNCLKSVLNHLVFGLCLYVAARLLPGVQALMI